MNVTENLRGARRHLVDHAGSDLVFVASLLSAVGAAHLATSPDVTDQEKHQAQVDSSSSPIQNKKEVVLFLAVGSTAAVSGVGVRKLYENVEIREKSRKQNRNMAM